MEAPLVLGERSLGPAGLTLFTLLTPANGGEDASLLSLTSLAVAEERRPVALPETMRGPVPTIPNEADEAEEGLAGGGRSGGELELDADVKEGRREDAVEDDEEEEHEEGPIGGLLVFLLVGGAPPGGERC